MHQDRLCGVRVMDASYAYRGEGDMKSYNGACQSYLDLCKKQLHGDLVTTSPPPSLLPEPLDLVNGRDSPPSPWASPGLPE